MSASMARRTRMVTASETAIDSSTRKVMVLPRLWNSSRAAA
jgi:hypothetical protein